jgi:hypothetical protein
MMLRARLSHSIVHRVQVEREDVKEAMVFALDNADACGEVVDILYEALTLPETPIPLKVRFCNTCLSSEVALR